MTLNPSETKMSPHDSSDPGPIPIPPTGFAPPSDTTGEWLLKNLKKARAQLEEHDELVQKHESEIQSFRTTLGTSPNSALGIPGGGLLGGFAMICTKVDALVVSVEKMTSAYAADQASAEKRRASVNWVIAKAVGAFIVLAVGAAFVWAATLHH